MHFFCKVDIKFILFKLVNDQTGQPYIIMGVKNGVINRNKSLSGCKMS